MKLFDKLNWIAAIVSAITSVFLGFIWYGFLFLEPWMAGNNYTWKDDKKTELLKNGMLVEQSMTPMILNFFLIIGYAVLINWLINKTNEQNLKGGLSIGLILGFISCSGVFIGNMFAGNPINLSYCDGIYSLLLFCIIGSIMGAWRKKVKV